MSVAVEAAVNGRQEFAFWPAIAFGYIYSRTGHPATLFLAIVLAFSGAPMYILIRETRKLINQPESRKRSRRSRKKKSLQHDENPISELTRIGTELIPDTPTKFAYVIILSLLNIVSFLAALGILVVWTVTQTITYAGLVILLLPTLYISVVVSTLIIN